MDRPLRVEEPGATYHVTARGNAREAIYRDGSDRELFDAVLERTILRSRWVCLAYCQMGNHFHLVIHTPVTTLASGMQLLCGEFARRFNKRHGRVGHVFQSRYGAARLADGARRLMACRYTVLNPVRAGLVEHARDWRWSSYAESAGLAPNRFVDLRSLLSLFHVSPRDAYDRYRAFVDDERRVRRAA